MTNATLLGQTVYNVSRCAHCGVANPLLVLVHPPTLHYKDSSNDSWFYVTVRCSKCNRQILFYGYIYSGNLDSKGAPTSLTLTISYPQTRIAADTIPDRARSFLQQALESIHAPDGALMLAASAVDSMLKEKGYKSGSLFTRIGEAYQNGVLTEQMRDWAHEIRLSANEPRHADDEFAGATTDDAKQVIEFAEALGEYLYVLPSRVQKWKSVAQRQSA